MGPTGFKFHYVVLQNIPFPFSGNIFLLASGEMAVT